MIRTCSSWPPKPVLLPLNYTSQLNSCPFVTKSAWSPYFVPGIVPTLSKCTSQHFAKPIGRKAQTWEKGEHNNKDTAPTHQGDGTPQPHGSLLLLESLVSLSLLQALLPTQPSPRGQPCRAVGSGRQVSWLSHRHTGQHWRAAFPLWASITFTVRRGSWTECFLPLLPALLCCRYLVWVGSARQASGHADAWKGYRVGG